MPMHIDSVSVIMPVHNGGKYLAAAVDSILAQDDINLELLIIDDRTNDGSIAALRPSSKVNILKSPGKGIVTALNLGLDAAQHNFIARMDGDDIAHPQRLRTQVDYLNTNPDVDICGTKVTMFSESSNIGAGYLLYEEWINSLCLPEDIEREFFIESPISHPTVMMRRATVSELGGYHDSLWAEDYDLWCRALIKGMRFGKPSAEALLKWRDHGSRTSRVEQRYDKQHFLMCKAYYLSRYLKLKGISDTIIWGTGPTGLKFHDYLIEQEVTVGAFVDVNPKMKGRTKRNTTVVIASSSMEEDEFHYQTGTMLLIAVSARGARMQIREFLNKRQLREGEHYLCVA